MPIAIVVTSVSESSEEGVCAYGEERADSNAAAL